MRVIISGQKQELQLSVIEDHWGRYRAEALNRRVARDFTVLTCEKQVKSISANKDEVKVSEQNNQKCLS